MDKDINDYKYGDLPDDIKLKSFVQHSTPAEKDILEYADVLEEA